ncbi:hypothetical protein CR513_49685, partial [Mucuna pruriens]
MTLVQRITMLGIKQLFTSVEHPQTNGQAELANKVVLKGLRKRLEEAKERQAEEDLVLKRRLKDETINKLIPNWKMPFRIIEVAGKGAFSLEQLNCKGVPHT